MVSRWGWRFACWDPTVAANAVLQQNCVAQHHQHAPNAAVCLAVKALSARSRACSCTTGSSEIGEAILSSVGVCMYQAAACPGSTQRVVFLVSLQLHAFCRPRDRRKWIQYASNSQIQHDNRQNSSLPAVKLAGGPMPLSLELHPLF